MIAAMADAGCILPAYPFIESQIQPASLDLRLGDVAFRVRASFLPGPGATVADRIEDLKLHEISLADDAVLETNCVYIVPLIESLALPPSVAAAANPKSSTGRLDVFTRVITDGTRLSQVRFRQGEAALDGAALAKLHAQERLVDSDAADLTNGLALSVDLTRESSNGFIGYRAKRHTGVVD